MEPDYEFRIYVNANNEDYYNFVVFEEYEDLFDYCDEMCTEEIKRDYFALTHSMTQITYAEGEEPVRSNCVGFIAVVKEKVINSTVAHECFHALNYYYNYIVGETNYLDKDEEIAWNLGYMVHQIDCYMPQIFTELDWGMEGE